MTKPMDTGLVEGKRLPALFRYIGAKWNLAPKYLRLFPSHRVYVEAFGGSAALLFSKRPSRTEVLNDIDSDIVNLFEVIRDEETFAKFKWKCEATPYSQELFESLRNPSPTECRVERAWRWWVMHTQRAGIMDVWCNPRHRSAVAAGAIVKIIDALPKFKRRLQKVRLHNMDWRDIIAYWDLPDAFFFLDPPYFQSYAGFYENGMSADDHAEFLETCLSLEGKVMICGVPSTLYDAHLAEWRHVDIPKSNGGFVRKAKNKPVDRVWMNYEADARLF